MIKHILCSVDTSGEADIILQKAVKLAKIHEAKLSLITVIEYSFLPKDYQKKLKAEVIPKLNRLGEKYSIAKRQRYVKFGKSYTHICDLAEKKEVDLIVLGSHSKKGLQAVMGSTANGVIQRAPCDVFLIKMA